MRKFLIVLCLIIVFAAMTQICSAADSSMEISSAAFSEYCDQFGNEDDSLLLLTIEFDGPESVSQVTVLLTGAEISQVNSETMEKIIHMDQMERPIEDKIYIALEKSRIAAACGQDSADNAQVYLKVGGNGVTSASTTVTYTPETPHYGDLNGDGSVDFADALLILRYEAELTELTVKQVKAGDVTSDGCVNVRDAVRILRYEAKLEKTLVKEQGGLQ